MKRVQKKERGAARGLATWSEPAVARPALTRAQVVRRALELLDEEGFDALTMRSLAERLGIKAASLYNHVSNKDELLALLAEAICEEIPSEPEHAGSWREQLEAMGLRLRAVLLAHRDSARVLAATAPSGPQRLRLIERLLHLLRGAGFSAAETADASFVFNSYVVGFVLDETLGRPSSAAASKRWREEGRRWFKALPEGRYPTVVALADELVDAPADRRFALGVRALLDGLELRLAAR